MDTLQVVETVNDIGFGVVMYVALGAIMGCLITWAWVHAKYRTNRKG